MAYTLQILKNNYDQYIRFRASKSDFSGPLTGTLNGEALPDAAMVFTEFEFEGPVDTDIEEEDTEVIWILKTGEWQAKLPDEYITREGLARLVIIGTGMEPVAIDLVVVASSGSGGATAQEVWEYATRTLTSAGSGGATAQEVWEYTTRLLTTSPATPSDVSTAISTAALATASSLSTVSGKIDTVDGIVDAIKLKTDYIPSATIPSKTELDSALGELPTASENAIALLAATIRTGRTVSQVLRLLEFVPSAVISGLTSGEGSPVTFTMTDGSTITYSVDANKNRTSVTIDLA